MSLIDRVHERVETDLSDDELQAMIDEVAAELDRRYGANAAATRILRGGTRLLSVWRPIDEGQPVTVIEIDAAGVETTLAAADYRVLDGGRTLERLNTGPNGRTTWDRLVKITATPISDLKQREEVIVRVVQLEVQARGLTGERAGDWQASYPDLAAAREAALNSLASRRGLQLG
ncbi:MAG: hypothetical protein ACE5GS_15155 [Kiloniellaceae bacterium]